MKLSKRALETKGYSTLAISAKSKKLLSEGKDLVAFTVGEPDFHTPDYIKKAGILAIEEGKTTYTAASGILEFKEAICEKLKRDNNLDYSPENIVVSNGG